MSNKQISDLERTYVPDEYDPWFKIQIRNTNCNSKMKFPYWHTFQWKRIRFQAISWYHLGSTLTLLHFMVLSPMICWQHQCDMGGNLILKQIFRNSSRGDALSYINSVWLLHWHSFACQWCLAACNKQTPSKPNHPSLRTLVRYQYLQYNMLGKSKLNSIGIQETRSHNLSIKPSPSHQIKILEINMLWQW